MDLLRTIIPGRPRSVAGLTTGLTLAIVLSLTIATGCSSLNDRSGSPGSPSPAGEERAGDPAEEDEEGPLRAWDPGAGTPERAASERVVERGLASLRDGEAAEAARLLERAVRIDPSNGRAYLHLAQARMMLEEYGEARGLLDRAAANLRASPGLRELAEHLRASLADTTARPDSAGPSR